MPPKSKNQVTEEEPTLADVYKLMKAQSEQLTAQSEQLAAVKTLVVSLTEENKELRSALKQKDEQMRRD